MPAVAKKTLTWYAYHQPPAYIFKGEYKGLGYVNLVQQLIINALPQYQHVEIQVAVGRVIHDMKLEKEVCAIGLYANKDRKRYIAFSEPAIMNRNLHVLIKKEKADKLALNSSVNLDELFQKYGLATNLIDGRAYGTTIDMIIKKHLDKVSFRSSKSDSALYQMLERDRFDFLLIFPGAANYAIETKLLTSQYKTLRIENVPPFVTARIGCSKTAWGKKTVADINSVLKQVKQSSAYFNALSSWSAGSSDKQEFKQFYYNEFLTSTSAKSP